MVIRNAETTQGEDSLSSAAPAPADQLRSRAGNTVFKSGPLFISSKGIGWTSWKKRWFILTRTSLVFFRSDPSVLPQKGSEVNLTLGGIDLNNSGSVVVREDKKLLTVLFPDGRDGRAFTLKAETTEDLNEWKTALENALAQAPSAAIVVGQNAIFQNDLAETTDGPPEQIVGKEKQPVKSLVVGRPILLALEDVDGTPSFLEKALTYIEQHGVKVEGILRQAADVDDVERRVREYEQGKTEFSPEEDAHVIADCVKHVLRELPSSPVPASCCNALLQACRTERGGRIKAMRAAISETFPEPNRHLLQRILRMMQVVASHKSENRMSSSAVAACMAPLLLRPLLAGDLELDHDFNVGGDGSVQLLQAAAAANHAQTIVITLLEEHEKIFGDGILQDESISPELGSETDECGSDDYEPTEEEENLEDDEYIDSVQDSDVNSEDDPEGTLSGSVSESSGGGDDQYQDEVSEGFDSDYESSEVSEHFADDHKITCDYQTSISHHDNLDRNGSLEPQVDSTLEVIDESHESPESVSASTNLAAQSVPASMNLALRSPASTNLAPQSYPVSSNSAPGCVPASTNLAPQCTSVSKNIAPQCTPASSNSAPQDIPISTNLAPQSTPASTNVASQSVPTLTNFATRSVPVSTNLASQRTQALANGASQNLPAPTNSATQCVLAPINLAPNSVLTSTGLAHKTNVQSLSSSNTKMTIPSVKRPTVWGRTSARKNLSMESIDFAIEAEAAIERLEVTRTNLQNKIAKEVKENEVLHSSLETRKKALHVHRLALEKDVENLKEQLQKERDIKVAMEARYNLPLGCLPASSALDDETKAELEEISQAEEDISNLTKKLAKLHMQLNQQRSENHLFFSDQQNLPQKNGSNQEIKNDEQEDLEDTIANSHAKSTRSEDSSRVKKSQEKSSLRTQSGEKQQMDLTNIECSKPAVTTVTASSVEPAIVASSPSSYPKKSSTKSEGTITTSYALSKLTTRLNFLKERRSQIVNELQSIDNSKVPSEGQLARAPARSTSG